jgi:hypothetical protein
MLMFGAVVGIAIGVLLQPFLDMIDEDIRGLVRVAMLLPGAIFTVWWLLSPRPALEQEAREEDLPGPQVLDVQERIQQIESTFDAAAVPAARRHAFEHDFDDAREELERTLPRERFARGASDTSAYRVRRGGQSRQSS